MLGGLNPELKKYFLRYQKDLSDFKEVSTKRELLTGLQGAHIVLCGDYHTLSQAQRTVIRLLRDAVPVLKRRKRTLILALEMVRPKDNPRIAEFLEGELPEADFLRAISFRKNWGFHWSNYRRLFQFARENTLRIVGINYGSEKKPKTLKQRDRFAAKVIAELSASDEKAVVFVLVGDTHLAQAHLPREIELALKKQRLERTVLTIHQNNERLYWKLVEMGLEQLVDVLKLGPNEYCVMNTPPWIKLRSHVKWAELMAEGEEPVPLLRKKGGKSDSSEALGELGYADEIRELISAIQHFLGFEEEVEDDFHVYSPADLSFLNRLARNPSWSPLELRVVAKCLTEFEAFFIAREKIIYLTEPNLNHAATQAALYLHCIMSGREKTFTDPAEDFYAEIWAEALGYFGSKIINHKRKCNGPRDLKRIVESANTKPKKRSDAVRVAEAALAQLEAEHQYFSGQERVFRASPRSTRDVERIVFQLKVAKVLGKLLGHGLHRAVMENKVSRAELQALFENPLENGAEARKLYLDWIRLLDGFGFLEMSKTERL